MALIGFVPLYGWLASRVDRLKLIVGVLLFFIVCIELFFLGGRLQVPMLGFVFYIWVGIFSLATIAQFWSFANDIYRQGRGDRLFPLIAIGQTGGAAGRLQGGGAAVRAPRGPVPDDAHRRGAAAGRTSACTCGQPAARRGGARAQQAAPAAGAGPRAASRWSWRAPTCGSSALLLIVLNVVNTQRASTSSAASWWTRAAPLAADPAFDPTSFIGASRAATSSG